MKKSTEKLKPKHYAQCSFLDYYDITVPVDSVQIAYTEEKFITIREYAPGKWRIQYSRGIAKDEL